MVVSDDDVVIFRGGLGQFYSFGERTQLMHAPRVYSIMSSLSVSPIPVIISWKHFHFIQKPIGCRLHASWWPVDSKFILHSHVNSLKLLTQAEAPIIYMYMYIAMASALAYCQRLPMPLEHFVYLLVGLMHFVCNCREFWVMRNLHALLGVQQGFRLELATNYAFLINLKTKKVVIIDADTVWSWRGGHWVQTECNQLYDKLIPTQAL